MLKREVDLLLWDFAHVAVEQVQVWPRPFPEIHLQLSVSVIHLDLGSVLSAAQVLTIVGEVVALIVVEMDLLVEQVLRPTFECLALVAHDVRRRQIEHMAVLYMLSLGRSYSCRLGSLIRALDHRLFSLHVLCLAHLYDVEIVLVLFIDASNGTTFAGL